MSDEDIPTLDDVVRPGSTGRRRNDAPPGSDPPILSDEEIEAITRRVVDRYTQALEKAITRAIKRALDEKAAEGKD